jgi:ribonuclease P protein component
MRLPRKHTIKQRNDFVKVRTAGNSKAGKFIVLSVLRDESLSMTKVAYITTKKVGKAHERNLIRRRLRVITQKYCSDFTYSFYFVVAIARYNTITASFAELEKDWLKQARRLGLMPSLTV